MTEVSNITDYISWIENCYKDYNEESKLLFFRGHADSKWKLLPSVLRQRKDGRWYNERELILDFKQVSVSGVDYHARIENILVEMQHYGIPTRMLDWSMSPLIALYFACQHNTDKETGTPTDGKVYALNPWKVYRDSFIKKLTPHSELMDILKECRMLLAQRWTNEEIAIHIVKKYDYTICEELLRLPLPIVGRYIVNRVATQRSGFVIWGNRVSNKATDSINPPILLDEYQEYRDSIKDISIPASYKENLLEELRKFGIDDFVVFPDNNGIQKQINSVRSIFNYK